MAAQARRVAAHLAAISFLLLGPCVVAAEAAADTPTTPRRVFGLHRLQSFRACASPEDSARLCLSFLQEEIANPTTKTRGLGNGFITHEYVLAQIVLAAAQASPQPNGKVLHQAARDARAGSYRDCIGLTLGLMGDRTVVPFLINYAADETNPPNLRERAIRALGKCPDARAIPVLATALSDPYYVYLQDRMVYVIRVTARSSLLRLKAAGIALPADVEHALAQVVTWEQLPPDAVIP